MLNEKGFIIAVKSTFVDRNLHSLKRSEKPIDFMNDVELMAVPTGAVFIFDVECYVNFFYVAFKCLWNNKYVALEQSPDCSLNSTKLQWMLWRFCFVGFNSINYDMPMMALALKGATNAELKEASNFIVQSGIAYGTKKTTPYDFEKKYRLKIGRYNHIDLFNVCPVNGGLTATPASLKLYAGRLHAQRLQDLPFSHDHVLTQEEAKIVRPYCCNDLDNTEVLCIELAPEIKLRIEMGEQYGVDLRSKSDAQVAEAVINSELEKVLGFYPEKPKLAEGTTLVYNVPDFIKFKTPKLNAVLEQIRNAVFDLDKLGSPVWPKGLGEVDKEVKGEKKYILKVKMGKSTYKLGMGGLHSTEKSVAHIADSETEIADNDVESYYPRIILNQRLFPSHLGEAFLTVYEAIVNRRVDAKGKAKALKACDKIAAAGFKTIADTLKIVINGSFGKLGNKYSTLYAPQLMLQVTITGQLCLLMLIEMLEMANIEVISANTDGVISKYLKKRRAEVRAIIADWEKQTAFKTEETLYSAVYSRDVNNYVAVKIEGGDESERFLDERLGVKTKGSYSERGSALNSILSKNPETLVCSDAVVSMLAKGIPVEKTIRECKDTRRFCSIKNVAGGGVKNGVFLGKVVRWYYPKNEPGFIQYAKSGNKVGKTDGGKALMDLPESLPDDIDYNWYIKETRDMLHDLGFYAKAKTASLF